MTSYTVTATNSDGSHGISVQVEVLTGATEAGGAKASIADGGGSSGTDTVTLTPNFSGSFIAQAWCNATSGLTSFTPATNNKLLTVAANTSAEEDTTNGSTLGAAYYSGTVTGGSGVTVGWTNTNGASGPELAAYEVPAVGSWAEDASTPAYAFTTTTNAITTASFSPPPGTVLVAIVSIIYAGVANPTTATSVSSTPALTWTLRAASANATANGGAAVFTATVPPAAGSPPPFVLNPPGRQSPLAFSFLPKPPVSYDITTPAATANGTVQPSATRQPRRSSARAVWKGFTSQTTNLYNGTTPDHLVVARRTAARAVWKGFVSSTTNLLNGNDPGGVVYRRKAARAVWKGFTSSTTNLLNGNPPNGVVYRRRSARAVIYRGPAPFPPPIGTVPDHLVIARRSAARAVWRGFVSSTTNLHNGNQPGSGLVKRRIAARAVWYPTRTSTTNLLNGNQPDGLVRRRQSARAVWAGTVSRTVNATVSGGNGTAPLHLVVARRNSARAVWRGFVSSTTNLLYGNPPGSGLVKRRTAARAVVHGNAVSPQVARVAQGRSVARRFPARVVWAGTTVRTVNTVPTVSGTVPDHLVVARRSAARVFWRGFVSSTVNAAVTPVAATPHLVVPRRVPGRAVWRGGPVPGLQPHPLTGGLVRRRAAGRVLWRGVAVRTSNAQPVAVPAPKMRPRVVSRAAARAFWRSSGPQPFNASTAVLFSLGLPFALWGTGELFTCWGTDLPFINWESEQPFTDWETGLPFTEWAPGQVLS